QRHSLPEEFDGHATTDDPVRRGRSCAHTTYYGAITQLGSVTSQRRVADAIQTAYDDLFTLNRNAQTLSIDEVKGKFKSLTQGQKSENVIGWMANTFHTLCELADWSAPAIPTPASDTDQPPPTPPPSYVPTPPPVQDQLPVSKGMELHYNIQLILPESRDQAVYDALFSSLRRHLM
ncbi:MAG: DUF5343 domain-containing protein, partial [Planctomycetales bacterium]|nr:DUF5343 domain-containing protein [Planctomycetales bacterium]